MIFTTTMRVSRRYRITKAVSREEEGLKIIPRLNMGLEDTSEERREEGSRVGLAGRMSSSFTKPMTLINRGGRMMRPPSG